jgi:hypothetical protein
MNELTEIWVVVKKQGGMPENWLYKEIHGRRVLNAKEARDLQKANPGWEMLHAHGHYEPPEHVGDPEHHLWKNGHLGEYPGVNK